MKLQSNSQSGGRSIAAHGPGWIEIAGSRYLRSLVVTATAIDPHWGPDSFEALAESHLAALAAFEADVLLLGTGSRQRFPPTTMLRALIEKGVGIEIMDTAAACRTFNLLAAENRSVVAALIVE
jgi:uncharacterized protein